MEPLEFAISLFRRSNWIWTRETVKNHLLASGASLLRAAAENGWDLYSGPGGEQVAFIFGGDPRAPFLQVLFQEREIAHLDENERSQAIEEYDAAYDGAVARARGLLGDHAFEGTSAGSPLTSDQYGDLIACWTGPSARFTIQELQLDREAPIQICAILAPPRP